MTDDPNQHRTRQRELIRRICTTDSDLAGVAEAIGVDLAGLADVADEPTILRAMEVLRRLDGLRNEHWLGRYRAFAVAGLVRLIEQTDDPELSRKAAVDLLKADLATPVTDPTGGKGGAEGDDAEPTDAEAVLEALRRIGVDDAPDPADCAESAESAESAKRAEGAVDEPTSEAGA